MAPNNNGAKRNNNGTAKRSTNGARNLKTSKGRAEARKAKFIADPELMGLFANYIINRNSGGSTIPSSLMRKLIRTEWIGNNKSLVPYRNGKLNSKIFKAFSNAGGNKLVKERKNKIEAQKKANAQAKRNKEAENNAKERARVNKLKLTAEGRATLARENANARERALQNNLRHGGHFAAWY